MIHNKVKIIDVKNASCFITTEKSKDDQQYYN
jgi:hypothetical protein